MKWRYQTIVGVLFLGILFISGCKKYLDIIPPNVGTLDYAFRNRNEAEKYLYTCYSTLQGLSNVANNPWFVSSGELIMPGSYLQGSTRFINLQTLFMGTYQNVNNPILNYWNGGNGGTNLFIAIRRCNIMLENIDKPVDLSDFEKARWIAEVKFLKAYYYFFLAKMYGPLPIMRQNIPIDAPTEAFRLKREPIESVFNYILQLLEEAIPSLPDQAEISAEFGRITQVIAMSLKAEVLVAKASPLFNGNPDYANFKDKDGALLFPAATNIAYWRDAAIACKTAIDVAEQQLGLGLYSFIPPATIKNLSDSLNKEMAFRGAITEEWDKNKELIWALNPGFPRDLQSSCQPLLVAGAPVEAAWNILMVPFSITDLFYSKNGVPIEEDRDWDYSRRFDIATGDISHRLFLRQGYETIKNNFNREIRYYASFGFDGGNWFGNGVTDQNNLLYIAAKKGGFSGANGRTTTNMSAIWPKKLVNYLSVRSAANNGTNTIAFYRLPLIRLADLYLLYAECLNEASGPSAEVYKYIDLVRARVGLEGVEKAWAQHSINPNKPQTKEGLRSIIHRERRIELCLEGKAGWDLRRWKEYTNEVNKPVQGWSIESIASRDFYNLFTLYVPGITDKDYLWPIQEQELLFNKNLVQNPMW